MYSGLSTASEVFLIFTTQIYQYCSVIFLFALFSDEPELFLSKYSQTAILHAHHFRRVVKIMIQQCYNIRDLPSRNSSDAEHHISAKLKPVNIFYIS